MADWFEIDYTVSIAIKKPITFEHGRAFYLNPIAIAEGAPGAPRVAIDVDGQTAIATDEVDTFKRLAPDGLGSVRWALPLEGGTVSLDDSGTVNAVETDEDLESGLWLAIAFGLQTVSSLEHCIGYAWLLNGTIIRQKTLDLTATSFDGGAFAFSGSGPTKTLTFTNPLPGSSKSSYMSIVRMA